MQIHTPYDGIRDTDYGVHVNPGSRNGYPFAVIAMGDGCHVEMTGRRDDMERLMVAAATALAMLDAGERPHPWQDGTPGHCGACGRLRPDPVHEAAAAAACADVAEHADVTCDLPPGHDGRHEHRPNGRPSIVWGPGVTEPARQAPITLACGHSFTGPVPPPVPIAYCAACDRHEQVSGWTDPVHEAAAVPAGEPLPDCAARGCGHAEEIHFRRASEPMAHGHCLAVGCGCPAYLLAGDGEELAVIGRIVARAEDDSPGPLTGRVVGQLDEERPEVAWGDEQYSDSPRTSVEFHDGLRPVTA